MQRPPPNPNNPYPPPGFGPEYPQQPQQQYPYPPPYPAPYPYPGGYPMQMAPRNDSEATTIFVLGLMGFMFCQLLAPIAWIKGSSYRATCRATEQLPNGLATAGWILGIVGTVLLGISLLAVAVGIIVGAVS
jgi:hypothetical protein